MTEEDQLRALSHANLDKAKLKRFVSHMGKFEADTGFESKQTLINGIPPFDDIATVIVDIPKDRLGGAIERLLGNPRIKPDILINGIPSLDHFDVHVDFGGR